MPVKNHVKIFFVKLKQNFNNLLTVLTIGVELLHPNIHINGEHLTVRSVLRVLYLSQSHHQTPNVPSGTIKLNWFLFKKNYSFSTMQHAAETKQSVFFNFPPLQSHFI